jgi:tetratricopeptide (TPR) repeat protein
MKKTLLYLLLLSGFFPCAIFAQSALSPEVLQMQRSANNYLDQKDFANAIMLFNQAIRMAPDNVSLRRDLAYTYYISGKVKKAKEVIDPVMASAFADEQTFQVASAIESTLGNYGKAKRILKNGLEKFPHSGLLFHSQGLLYSKDKSDKSALEAWENGIKADPSYALNYFSAANMLFRKNEPAWALLYAEIYLNLEQNPARGVQIKKLMIDAYQAIFSPGNTGSLPSFDKKSKDEAHSKQFIDLYRQVLLDNVSTIRNGLNTESLVMLRARFIMEWEANFGAAYPFSLFNYQNKIIHEGYFDAYNQWLFGAYNDSKAYSLWIKKHAENFSAFEKWRQLNPLQPAAYDPRPEK